MLTRCHLRVDDCLAACCGIDQRLFAEYRLAGLNCCDDRVLVERARCSDNDRINIRVVDGCVEVCVNLDVTTRNFGALLHAFLEYIAHSDNLCAANAVLNTLDMFAADHATSDDCDL